MRSVPNTMSSPPFEGGLQGVRAFVGLAADSAAANRFPFRLGLWLIHLLAPRPLLGYP